MERISEPAGPRRLFRHEDGSNLVEFSLVVLPLLAVVFLTINTAWDIFAKSTLEWAVRQGVRYAVTSQTMSGLGQDASVRTVVQQNAFGFLDGNTGANLIAINYYDPITQQPTQSNGGGNIVQVSVQGVLVNQLAPLGPTSGPLSLSAISSDVMESSPGGIPPQR